MKLTPRKKIGLTLVGIIGLGASLLGTTSADAASSKNTPTRYISLSSTGTVKVLPDAVRLNASVSLVGASNKEALSTASTASAAVRAALLANGIVTKYIKTTSLTVYPEYNYTQDKGSVLIGYRASQSFDVTIVNAQNAGTIVDAVVAAGTDALRIDGVTPFVLDNAAATESARVDAVKRARTRAASYAKLMGVKLGPVIYMEETSTPTSYPIMYGTVAKSDAGATQVDLGQQDVSVSINIRFYIN
ncbi:MAG: SIMPL domain-containing protein [Actinomycetes bacterium]|jgi:uncharacterized protein